MSDYEVFFRRNADLKLVGEVDDYDRLTVVVRFNGVGAWSLEYTFTGAADDAEREAEIDGWLRFGYGVMIRRDDEVILSGPVTGRVVDWTNGLSKVTVSGEDDLVWLRDRVAVPTPAGPPYTDSHDVRTGSAEGVMKEYVYYNAGAGAKAERRVSGLVTATSCGLGGTVTGRARFKNLVTLLQELALAGGDLGFRVVQVDETLEFQVYNPTDRTGSVTFSSEMGNLLKYRYKEDAPKGNYVLIGGQGQAEERTIDEAGDSESIVRYERRIEMFKDQRNTDDAGELRTWMNKELAQNAQKVSLSLTAEDTEYPQFGVDYGLGDRVTGVVDGIEFYELVREVKLEIDADGETVTPVIGTAGSQGNALLGDVFERMREIGARLDELGAI